MPRQLGIYLGELLESEINDAEAALSAAPHKVDETYTTPRHNHNTIEPHAATVAWNSDELIVHGVMHTAWSLAKGFGLEEDRDHVTSLQSLPAILGCTPNHVQFDFHPAIALIVGIIVGLTGFF